MAGETPALPEPNRLTAPPSRRRGPRPPRPSSAIASARRGAPPPAESAARREAAAITGGKSRARGSRREVDRRARPPSERVPTTASSRPSSAPLHEPCENVLRALEHCTWRVVWGGAQIARTGSPSRPLPARSIRPPYVAASTLAARRRRSPTRSAPVAAQARSQRRACSVRARDQHARPPSPAGRSSASAARAGRVRPVRSRRHRSARPAERGAIRTRWRDRPTAAERRVGALREVERASPRERRRGRARDGAATRRASRSSPSGDVERADGVSRRYARSCAVASGASRSCRQPGGLAGRL